MTRNFETQRAAWERIPVDDYGYVDARQMLDFPDGQLTALIGRMEVVRYTGWRNYAGLWRDRMGLDSLTAKRILDYGSGTGIEALQYARNGNAVSVADINRPSLQLASRVLRVCCGQRPWYMCEIQPEPPFIQVPDGTFDVVVMNGVLHHIEHPVPVVQQAHRWLAPGGELRLMVYTDVGWRLATGTEPPADVTDHPMRERFVRWGDEVGDWADWYDAARLADRFGQWFEVEDFTYISHEDRYACALLRRKDTP